MFELFWVFSSGFVVSLLMMFFLRQWALRSRRLVVIRNDSPEKSGVDRIVIVGGIGIAVSLWFSLFLGRIFFGAGLDQGTAVVLASSVMLIFGILDDLREHSVAQKFILQLLCATLLVVGNVRTHIIYFGEWENIVITLVWILGITNAYNLLDIMDGLSAGAGLAAASGFLVISFIHPDLNVQMLSLGLCAAVSGFLVFNMPPARIYLGNAGSHFLGFIIAALALLVSYATPQRPLSLISPIIILWLPLLEVAVLIYFRLKKGVIPFYKSNDHMALKLSALGLSRTGSLGLMLGLALFFSLCGVMIVKVSTPIAWVVIGVVVMVSLIMFWVLRKAEKSVR